MDTIHAHKIHLEKLLTEITGELQAVGIHDPKNKSDWSAVQADPSDDDADNNLTADTIEEWNERTSLVETLEPRYNDIVRALEKIEAGTFGACEICGEKIEEERLGANPAARTCMTHIETSLT